MSNANEYGAPGVSEEDASEDLKQKAEDRVISDAINFGRMKQRGGAPIEVECKSWRARARDAATYAVAYVSTVVEVGADRLQRATYWVSKALAEATKPIELKRASRTRKWPISVGPEAIPPKSTKTIPVAPQCLFKGNKLLNTGDSDLLLQGLFVGQQIQIPFHSPIRMRAFNDTEFGNNLSFDTCDPALQITFQVENTTDEELTFSATIGGETVL